MTKRTLGRRNTHPELLALLEKTKGCVMTKEERDAQCKSWVIGEFMLSNPDATREYAEKIYERVAG